MEEQRKRRKLKFGFVLSINDLNLKLIFSVFLRVLLTSVFQRCCFYLGRPPLEFSSDDLTWPSGGKILFGEDVDGESGIATVDVASGSIQTLTHGPGQLLANGSGTAVSLAADGWRPRR